MPKIIKNNTIYGSSSAMVELTQAEYNSLSSAQKNNGTIYLITDSDPEIMNLSSLNDVNVSGATQGQVLTKGASSWEASTLNSGYFIKEYSGTMPTTQTNKYEEIETGVSSALLLGATVYDNSNSRYEPLPLGLNEASTIYNAHSTFFLNTAGSLSWRVFINSSAGVTKYGGQTVKFIFAVKK